MPTPAQTHHFFKSLTTTLVAQDWRAASLYFAHKSCFMVDGQEFWSRTPDEVPFLLAKWISSPKAGVLVDLKIKTMINIDESGLTVLDLDFIFSDRETEEVRMPVHGFVSLRNEKTSLYYLALNEDPERQSLSQAHQRTFGRR